MDISSMLEVQVDEVKEVDSKENVTPKDLNPSVTTVLPAISPEECNFYKLAFGNDISAVRFRRIHCTACDVHIGSAPAQAHNMLEHPILRTLLCAKCKEFYGDGTFEQGDDATDMFCRWCANGGNLYCCSYCSNTFCYKCIRRNFDSLVRKKIEADEKWKCFVCNPTDLYNARALCWALLQHVQTMTRLLQSDRVMSPEEIEERMNLDESECCPRRRKRKRRRTGSNSEEEDETYDPNINGEPIMVKRKALKRRYKHRRKSISNGNIPSLVPMKQCFLSPESVSNLSEGSTSLHSVEQTKADNVSTNSSSVFVSAVSKKQQDSPLSLQVDSAVPETIKSPIVKTTLYNSTINAVPTVKLLQSTAAFKPMHSMINPRFQVKNSYQTKYYSTTQMVTIPNQKHPLTFNRPRVLLPRPKPMVQMMLTPNIIDLDSDSDEPTVVQSMNSRRAQNTPTNENTKVNISAPSTIAVPVALVSNDNSCNNNKIKINEIEDQPSRELLSNINKDEKSFRQIVLLPHKEEFDNILYNFKVKFNQILKDSKNEEINRNNIKEARSKIQCLYREICNTVTQLAYINDRVVRKYSDWEKSQNTKDETTRNTINTVSTLEENNKIPLDMTCRNDSASDSESENNLVTLYPSKLIASTNVFEAFTKKKDTISHGVGDSSILCEDKSIQVYAVDSRDYEQVIGCSKLMKTDRDSLSENDISEPVTVSNKYLGKYQEQFIFYLQHIEDHGIEIDDTSDNDILKSLTDTETDSLTTETISKEVPSTIVNDLPKSSEKCTMESVNNVPDVELPSLVSESESASSVARLTETSTNNENVNKNVDERYVKLANSTRSEKQDSDIKEETLVEINSIISNEANSNENFCNAVTEDDCTIIDD
ncbi:hypothetical protein KPH14_011068 [Odynerus spinipes]|uniref:PHD-type domain-containing protein n=1 Tax=Odynerus spinipes TaxID=1348599 RepID=A0AAD9VM73_9HYME|nr:hypothetical protein KPH14_011068 [Odynerus spinipes]